MARLFTVTFPFEQKHYEAEITVDDAADKNSISVFLPDPSLQGLLPEGNAVLSLKKDEVMHSTNATPIDKIKNSILKAFEEHESQTPPENIW